MTERIKEVSRGEEGHGPTSVYVHLPFCRVKCTYCAFAISTDSRLEQRYVSALIREIRNRVPVECPLESVYFGGGTPSRLSPLSVERLAQELSRWRIVDGTEVTIEVNPEDVDRETVRMWVEQLGVNRISIGVQSFHELELRPLGRQHGSDVAIEAVRTAAEIVPRVSIDLILGLPKQSVESVGESTEQALTLPVGHLSLYLLDLEPGSALEQRVGAGLVSLPDDDRTAAMYREVVRRAGEAGLTQYEVSNFARPGQESVHNRRYWSRKSYLGMGLGAHSFEGTIRSGNTRSISEYMSAIEAGESPVVLREILTDVEIRHEKLFLGMRQTKGLPVEEFHALADERSRVWLDDAISQGWVEIDRDRVRFTVEGLLLSDGLLAQLF